MQLVFRTSRNNMQYLDDKMHITIGHVILIMHKEESVPDS
jgi:hypothetical protein